MAEVLCVVPCRGNSKGLARKNLRIVAGKPLLAYIVDTLADVEGARVVVSTEDAEIAAWCRLRGVEVVDRPVELAADDVPVTDVVAHAAALYGWRGPVVLAQPTCPLVTAATVRRLLAAAREHGAVVAVSSGAHLVWHDGELVTPPANRQRLEADGWATGVGLRAWNEWPYPVVATPVPVPPAEAVDIDTRGDLEHARLALARRRVHMRVNVRPGLGHLHRAVVLAEHLDHHKLSFSFHDDGRNVDPPGWAARRLEPFGGFSRRWPRGLGSQADLVLSDTLETPACEVLSAKAAGRLWVALEDRGAGSDHADLVVNELYVDRRANAVCGPRWAVLRPEFLGLPAFRVRDEGRRVLVVFGGNDEHSLSGWARGELAGFEVSSVSDYGSVAEAMVDADVLVTSCGRTVNEAAAVGVPSLAAAANHRETGHVHVDGVIYAGLHATVPSGWLASTVEGLLERPLLRAEVSSRMRSQIDGRGAERIARRVDDLLEGLS